VISEVSPQSRTQTQNRPQPGRRRAIRDTVTVIRVTSLTHSFLTSRRLAKEKPGPKPKIAGNPEEGGLFYTLSP